MSCSLNKLIINAKYFCSTLNFYHNNLIKNLSHDYTKLLKAFIIFSLSCSLVCHFSHMNIFPCLQNISYLSSIALHIFFIYYIMCKSKLKTHLNLWISSRQKRKKNFHDAKFCWKMIAIFFHRHLLLKFSHFCDSWTMQRDTVTMWNGAKNYSMRLSKTKTTCKFFENKTLIFLLELF